MEDFNLPNQTESLEGIAEQYQGLYSKGEDDTSYSLDSSLAEKLDVTKLKSSLHASRKEHDQVKKELRRLNEKYEGLDIDPDEMRKLVASNKEQSQVDDKHKKQLTDNYEKQLKVSEGVNNNLKERLRKTLVDDASTRAILEEKGVVELLLPLVKSRIKVDFDDELNPNIKVFDAEGEPMVGDDGKYLTVNELVKYLKTNENFSRAFNGEVKSGGGIPEATKTGRAGLRNPWSKSSENYTEQGKILMENPALAVRLKKEAGVE